MKGRVVGKSVSRDCSEREGTPLFCIPAPSSSLNLITIMDTTCTATAAAEGEGLVRAPDWEAL